MSDTNPTRRRRRTLASNLAATGSSHSWAIPPTRAPAGSRHPRGRRELGVQLVCRTRSRPAGASHHADAGGRVLSDSIVEEGISTTSRFLAAPDLDVAERVAGARWRVPSVSVIVGLMPSDGKAIIPSAVTTSPTSSMWSSPRLFAGAPSKSVRRASRMGLSCSLKLSTSTPRGYADRLSVVRTTEYVAIDQSSDRVDRNVLLTHPARSSRANDPKRCRWTSTLCHLPINRPARTGRHARERFELCPPTVVTPCSVKCIE
jgi:hypothetical protein